MDFEKLDVAMEDTKVVQEDGLLKPLPPEAEAELDRVLDKEDIDWNNGRAGVKQ